MRFHVRRMHVQCVQSAWTGTVSSSAAERNMQCQGIGPTSLMASHFRALSPPKILSATLMKCWLSSWATSRLWSVASVPGWAGTSAARDSSWMMETMSVGSSASCCVSSKAWAERSSRAEASARLLRPDGCCTSAAFGGGGQWHRVRQSYKPSLFLSSCVNDMFVSSVLWKYSFRMSWYQIQKSKKVVCMSSYLGNTWCK